MIQNTNSQKILSFLSEHFGAEYYGSQIAQLLGISVGSVSENMGGLVKNHYVIARKLGKMTMYSINIDSPVIRQYRVLANVEYAAGIVSRVTKLCNKIVLFGSYARGTNTTGSDIDIFISTEQRAKVAELLKKSKTAKLQPIILTSGEYLALRANDTVFYDEINKGIILWEDHERMG